ncbi:MAG: NERD domain-containing protein [Streptosporangiaceae bacterium]|nr:NERD domain-containing protein [Streptosporangiaceae bacterium]
MALPKLRRRKQPGPLPGSRDGTAADTARPAAGDPAGAAGSPDADSSSSFWQWVSSEYYEPPGEEDLPGASGGDTDLRGDSGGDTDLRGDSAPPQEPVGRVASGEDADAEPRQPGIGQHLGSLAHLSASPRKRAWQRRAILAIVVGVAFSIAFSWRVGLTLAVAAAIADTIYRSRSGFPRAQDARATAAQRLTRRQLPGLQRTGYRALNGSLIPGSNEQIDHLVIGPAGVFAIDSEGWDKRIPVRARSHKQLWHGAENKKDRLDHARWEAQRAAELLSDALASPVSVRPAMAVYGPAIPWDVLTIRDVDVFSGPRLRKYLRHAARRSGVRMLSEPEIERIYKAAQAAFPHLGSGA